MAAAIIDQALETLAGEGELERARAVVRRRLPALSRAGSARAPVRLHDYLLRRGFSGAVVARVVREMIGPHVDAEARE